MNCYVRTAMESITPSSPYPTAPAEERIAAAVAGAADPAQRARAEQAAVKFEGLFIGEMFKQMRRSAEQIAGPDGLFKGMADNSLRSLADTMVADAMAGQRAFGIADAILQQLVPPAAPAPGAMAFKPAPLPVALDSETLSSSPGR
jgi:flagellar protein FlgJ